MFDRILVPVDGSEYSWRALNYAIEVAKKFSSKLYIVHIIHTIIALGGEASSVSQGIFTSTSDITGPSFMMDLKNQLEEAGRRILRTTKDKTCEAGISASTSILYGSPAEEIINFAEKKDADLIVIGDRGLGSVSRFFLGSVSNKVSRHAPCPVLIVKRKSV